MAAVDDLLSAELAFLATGDKRDRAPAPVARDGEPDLNDAIRLARAVGAGEPDG